MRLSLTGIAVRDGVVTAGRGNRRTVVVQSLFLGMLRREKRREFLKNPRGYLYRAAVNLSLTVVQHASGARGRSAGATVVQLKKGGPEGPPL